MNNLAHFVLANRLVPLMKRTAQTVPPATVRIVAQASKMHQMAPGSTQFLSKEEVNEERDGSQL